MAHERFGLLISLAIVLQVTGCDFLMVPPPSGGNTPGAGAPTTAMTRTSHEMYFPIAAGVHAMADCNSCHGGFASFKQFSCLTCHEHAQTTTDTTHKGVANYKYDSASCLSCHPSGTAGDLSRTQHTQFFPIDVGTPHANGQCADCHTTPGDKTKFSCLTCHDHAQGLTDTAHQGITNYKYDSPSCLSCHPQGLASELPRADHKKFFPIDTGTPHANGQCTDCHTTPGDKTKFSCLTCHDHAQGLTDTAHQGITNYKYDSPSCLSCHPQGLASELPRADHKKFFPIDTGTAHGNTACAECHTTPGDRSQFTCIACHDHEMTKTNADHQSVANYKYESPSCYSCHKDGTAVFDHATLPTPPNCISCHKDDQQRANVTLASKHVANGFPTTCESCHKSFKSWGPGTAMPHAVVGNTSAKCETCHLDNFTKGTTPFNHASNKVQAAACNMCHKDFTTWLKFNHSSNCFNGNTLRGHEGATCAQCHTVPTDYSKSSCTACHSNRGTNCDD